MLRARKDTSPAPHPISKTRTGLQACEVEHVPRQIADEATLKDQAVEFRLGMTEGVIVAVVGLCSIWPAPVNRMLPNFDELLPNNSFCGCYRHELLQLRMARCHSNAAHRLDD
jgi:hypothetical protein